MTDQVAVKIVGDASSGVAASNTFADAVERAANTAREKLAQASTSMKESFSGISHAAKEGAVSVAEAAEMMAVAGEKMAVSAEHAKKGYEKVESGLFKLRSVFLGLTAALAGGEAFEEVIDDTNKLNTQNLKLANTLGISLERASGLSSAMHKLGIGVDQVTEMSTKMVRQMKMHEGAFNTLGIATRDSNGHFRDQLDIMLDANDKLGSYKGGVDRTAAAMTLYGGRIGDLTNFLRLNNEQVEEGTRVAKELGLVTTSEGVDAMRTYKESVAEATEVFEAMKIIIGNALLPILTEMGQWFAENGPAAIEHTREAMSQIIQICRDTYAEIKTIEAIYQQLATNFTVNSTKIISDWNRLDTVVSMSGKIIYDALSLNWGAIEGDWQKGMDKLDEETASASDRIVSSANRAKRAWDDAAYAAKLAANGGKDPGKDYADGPFAFSRSSLTPSVTGGGEHNDNIAKEKKAKKEKKPKADPSSMSAWNEELQQGLLAEEKAGNDIIQFTIEFWQKKVAAAKAGSKDQLAAQTALTRAEIAGEKAAQAEKIAAIKQTSTLATEAAKTEIQLQKDTLTEKLATIEQGMSTGKIKDKEGMAQRAAVNAQLYALDLKLENDLYKIKLDELKTQAAMYNLGTKQRADYNRQIELLDTQHIQKLAVLNSAAALKTSANATKDLNFLRAQYSSLASSWGQALSKMATLQAGFGTTIKSLWGGITNLISGMLAKVIEQMVTQWLTAHGAMSAVSKLFGLSEVATKAGEAGAGGVASMAAAPFPLNLSAPAFGASMSAAALSFGSIASAAGGWDVPSMAGRGVDGRGGQVGIIHPREMVLPAELADSIRGGGGKGSGDIHIHALDAGSIKRFMMGNGPAVAAGVKKAVRDGYR
jgi:hypothetical protein